MRVGVLLSDLPKSWGPKQQFEQILRQVETAQRNGFTYICTGQHFLYGDYTYQQPIPLLARLAGEVNPEVRLVATIIVSPLYHPVLLAEELASLDVMSEGRLIVGLGLGYRKDEFDYLGVEFKERVRRFEEGLELMKLVWTQKSVTFTGEFWSLDGAEPHIEPWQSPHPPVWLGGHTEKAVRRAGRVGNGWIIPPAVDMADVKALLAIFAEEQARRGLAPTSQPLRRNVFLGRDRQDALSEFMRSSLDRYRHYAANEHEAWTPEGVEKRFAEQVGEHVLAGDAEHILADIRQISAEVPINPLILRAGWPNMDPDWFISYIDRLGAELVPGIKEVVPLDPAGGKTA
ncbi:MAG: luciferase [Pseudonocardiales bacterium]|nr:luciferase [Pseudonocardiales bacterium]